MADPVTILGAVAAGAQLVDVAASALLNTILLVKKLRDIPKKLAATLDDVEKSTSRVHYACSRMLLPGSKVSEQLDPGQISSLTQVADDLRQAMDVVCTTLGGVVGPGLSGNGKTIQRFWRSVLSVNVEKDVADQLERINRLNDELLRQLGMTSLELQAAVSQTLDRVASDVRDGQARLLDVFDRDHGDLRVAVEAHHSATASRRLQDISTASDKTQQTASQIQGSIAISSQQMQEIY
ncbi:hypothetical protein NKR19_g5699 [Coniochaeta hoffmannii]|uniref:Fungal N-terminal domain-containing protein n=1 Tax=Coniochaeta hoffmannii TaxID=91930 RepID=A0AA38VG33_9PEZI|nr:hypothetical protein NKR19_g5699 [Coniochaeta hoffmannii]